jgi:hypothetical protein
MKWLFTGDRLRSNFFGLILFCLMFLSISIFDNGAITIPVTPALGSSYQSLPIASFNNNIITGGILTIQHPSFKQRLLLQNVMNEFNTITLIGFTLFSILMIILIPKIKPNNIFKEDISLILKIASYGTIGFCFINVFLII